MAITDLTGTTWTLNSSLMSYAGGSYSLKTYVVNITTDTPLPVYGGTSDAFAAIAIGYDNGGERNTVRLYKTYPIDSFDIAEIATGEDTKSLPDPWQSYYSGTFTFTGGTDATNSALIDWVEDNCTEVVQPTIDVVVTYEGENIVELSDSGTKTLKTQGKYLTDDIMLEYVKSGGGGGSVCVHGTFTGTITGQAMDVSVDYSGNGYPIAVIVGTDDSNFDSLVMQYAVKTISIVKWAWDVTPTYSGTSNANYAMQARRYKGSSSDSSSYGGAITEAFTAFSNSDATSANTATVKIKDNTTLSVYIRGSSAYGCAPNIEYSYYVVYSS